MKIILCTWDNYKARKVLNKCSSWFNLLLALKQDYILLDSKTLYTKE